MCGFSLYKMVTFKSFGLLISMSLTFSSLLVFYIGYIESCIMIFSVINSLH